MSLGCGSCRETVRGGFGVLYRLHRNSAGELVYPPYDENNKPDMGGKPGQSVICGRCWWMFLPFFKKRRDSKRIRAKAESIKEAIFVYVPAVGNELPYEAGISMWGVEEKYDEMVFVSEEAVNRHFPEAIKIMDGSW